VTSPPLPPTEGVKSELAALLEAEPGRIGEVYRLTDRGMTPPQIAAELGVSSSGFVSNYRAIARALLEAHLPSGPSMARQVISGIHKVTGRAQLTTDAADHVSHLLEALDGVAQGDPRWTVSRSNITSSVSGASPQPSPSKDSLREQVEEQLRTRTRDLVDAIHAQLDLECDDYLRVSVGASPLDALQRLVQFETTSRTTRALHAAGRMDLSIETQVLEWTDLPLAADLTDSARGRLDYWSTS
jgi:hypothetical protein